jgi:DnaD/phage-associated family protein
MTAPSHPGAAPEPRRGGRFNGFLQGSRATVIPTAFFSEVLPEIEDEAEVRVTLFVFYALGRRKGYPRFASRRELEALPPLAESLASLTGEIADNLDRGLRLALERGTFLAVDLEKDASGRPSTGSGRTGLAGSHRTESDSAVGPSTGSFRAEPLSSVRPELVEGRADASGDTLIFLNAPGDRRAAEQVRAGALRIALPVPRPAEPPAPGRHNAFQLYEENIGPITPLIAEELREAERLYPIDWIEEALREAAVLNKRSWRYASRILERWAMEGRQGEKAGRDFAGDDARSRLIRRFERLAQDE